MPVAARIGSPPPGFARNLRFAHDLSQHRPMTEFNLDRLDVALDFDRLEFVLDLVVAMLVVIGLIMAWRLLRAMKAVRDSIREIGRSVERSAKDLAADRDEMNRLNAEILHHELAELDRRIKTLEDRAEGAP
jgi:hypothetical protein